MSQRVLRGCVAFASTAATATALLLTSSSPAGAAVPGIRTPTMTVVCSQPHHDGRFTAVRFSQSGLWGAGEKVTVAISTMRSERPRATVLSSTGSTGWFHISRTLVRKVALWQRGASYTWTTEISSASSVTARRGTVVLRGSC